jgi:hypothetical protein
MAAYVAPCLDNSLYAFGVLWFGGLLPGRALVMLHDDVARRAAHTGLSGSLPAQAKLA